MQSAFVHKAQGLKLGGDSGAALTGGPPSQVSLSSNASEQAPRLFTTTAFLPLGPSACAPCAFLQEWDKVKAAPARPLVTEKTRPPGGKERNARGAEAPQSQVPLGFRVPSTHVGPIPRT